ncbi:MAG: hypothetical protein HQK83_07280 [Fibrobacteria bacterium]|nr:hypothetical protein [Fibrobacteria bacterium]
MIKPSLNLLLPIFFSLYLLTACTSDCSGPDESGYYYCSEDSEDDSDIYSSDNDNDDDGGFDFSFEIFIEEDDEEDDSPDCVKIPPNYICHSAHRIPVTISIKIDSRNGKTPIRIDYYNGDFDTGTKIYSGSHHDTELEATLVPGTISATALYVVGTDSILAVDGVRIKTNQVNYCEQSCYEAEPVSMDLTLCNKFN